MPFMKVIKRVDGINLKVGTIVLVDDGAVNTGYLMDSHGNNLPTEILEPLTEEEASKCLKVEEIQI